MAIISITGRKQHGKDTVGRIIQDLTAEDWQIKKWADKLKDILCILIGCSREDLENEEFKNTPLGEEWRRFFIKCDTCKYPIDKKTGRIFNESFTTKEEAELFRNDFAKTNLYSIGSEILTPRQLLQLIGTECMRDRVHPSTWTNSLMREYKSIGIVADEIEGIYELYPNWIITDTRFPNELQAVRDRQGLCIKVIQDIPSPPDEHKSESSLDHITDWDYVIYNNGSMEELLEQVREILIKEKLL